MEVYARGKLKVKRVIQVSKQGPIIAPCFYFGTE
jgi:hypothetical protein